MFLIYCSNLNGQDNRSKQKALKNYFNYVIQPDSNTRAGLINLRYQYLFTPKSNMFRRGGSTYNLGFNIARLFSRKFIFGLCLETKIFLPSFIKHNANEGFINDFNASYINTYSNYNDSLRASILYDGINNQNNVSIKGSFPFYYGISFSPFPQKWGGVLLEVKKGGSDIGFYGKYDAKLLDAHGDDSPQSLLTQNNVAVELSFKPNKFVKPNPNCLTDLRKPKDILDLLVISFYYERFKLTNATFGDKPLNTMLNEAFIKKYSNLNYFGLKIGLGIY